MLPKGGSREDLAVTERLYDYISSQALEWFQFLDGYQKHILSVKIANGNLYLVTGVDKAQEWSTLSFWRMTTQPDEGSTLTVDYDYTASMPWNLPEQNAYTLEPGTCMKAVGEGFFTAPFVRGLRIGISPTAWKDYLPTNIRDSFYSIPRHSLSLGTAPAFPTSFLLGVRRSHPGNSVDVGLFGPAGSLSYLHL